MDWKFLITTTISAWAVLTAMSSKSQSARTAEEQKKLQSRIEVYNYYPIVEFDLASIGSQVKFVVKNLSEKNAVRNFKISTTLRIMVKDGAHSVDEDHQLIGDTILPNEIRDVYPEKLNETLSDSIAFIRKSPVDKVHIVVRAVMDYYAPHPDSGKKVVTSTSYLSLTDAGFIVHKSSVTDR